MRSLWVSVTVLALAFSAVAQHGAMTMPRNLAQMTDQAAVILDGYVVSAFAEPLPNYPNLMTVVVNVAVQDTLKGTPGRTYTFRQYVWDAGDAHDRLGYRKGQHVLLMMNAANEHGLSSPVGLQQGRFRIEAGPNGQEMAVNGNGNVGLFDGVANNAASKHVQFSKRGQQIVAAPPSGPVPAADLKDMIRGLAGAQP